MICKSCGREIRFIELTTGNWMLVDGSKKCYWIDPKGKGRIVTDSGEVTACTFDGRGPGTGLGWVPHWSTCTDPDAYRREDA